MTKEDIYDEQISPLMVQIISICKEHDIPLVADFQIDNDRSTVDPNDTFHCTTLLVPKDASPKTHELKRAASPQQGEVLAITITSTPKE